MRNTGCGMRKLLPLFSFQIAGFGLSILRDGFAAVDRQHRLDNLGICFLVKPVGRSRRKTTHSLRRGDCRHVFTFPPAMGAFRWF